MSRLTILEAYSQEHIKNCVPDGLKHLGVKYVLKMWEGYCRSMWNYPHPEPCSRCVHYDRNTIELVKELE